MLDVIKNKNKDQLKSQLQNVDDVFQKQKLVHSNVRRLDYRNPRCN